MKREVTLREILSLLDTKRVQYGVSKEEHAAKLPEVLAFTLATLRKEYVVKL